MTIRLCLAALLAPFLLAPEAVSQEGDGFRPLELRAGEISLSVRPQSPREAHAFLQWILSQMDFFQQNRYDVALPEHVEFDEAGEIGTLELFQQEVYDETQFDAAMEVIRDGTPLLQAGLNWFSERDGIEGFRIFEQYEVTITLYGPGGSYDPESGSVVLLANDQGEFKGGGGAHTILHELMHLAVEEGMVRRFGLTHWEKERLVDLLTQREFRALLPDYRLQPQGVEAIDPYVVNVPLSELAESLRAYTATRGKD